MGILVMCLRKYNNNRDLRVIFLLSMFNLVLQFAEKIVLTKGGTLICARKVSKDRLSL